MSRTPEIDSKNYLTTTVCTVLLDFKAKLRTLYKTRRTKLSVRRIVATHSSVFALLSTTHPPNFHKYTERHKQTGTLKETTFYSRSVQQDTSQGFILTGFLNFEKSQLPQRILHRNRSEYFMASSKASSRRCELFR